MRRLSNAQTTASRLTGLAKWAVVGLAVLTTTAFLLSSPTSRADPYSYPPFRHQPPLPSRPVFVPSPDVAYPDRAALQPRLLRVLRNALALPILSYDASLAQQQLFCPHLTDQSNPDQIRDDYAWWSVVPTEELERARERVVTSVAATLGFTLDEADATDAISERGAWEEHFGDGRRGIVFTGGNDDTAKRMLNSLTVLRKSLHCTLPVEIWGYASELQRLGAVRYDLEALGGVEFRASRFETEGGRDKQFQIKGEAIARSGFSEVLYLDSDNVPVRDPTFLFDSPVFRQEGIVVWPDFARDSPANPIWRMTGKNCDPEVWQAETGQLVVNKFAHDGLNLAALLAAEAMQLDHKFWFRLSGGDKDTFRYAFYLLDLPYTPAPHYLSSAGGLPSRPFMRHTHCGHTMLQYGLSSAEWALPDVRPLLDADYVPPTDHAPPLFVHANLLKHSGGFLNFLTFNAYNYHRGNTFVAIKLATPDLVHNSPSALLVSDIGYSVYRHRGLCTDIRDRAAAEGETGRVAVLDWRESWGGILRRFEDMFFDADGLTA